MEARLHQSQLQLDRQSPIRLTHPLETFRGCVRRVLQQTVQNSSRFVSLPQRTEALRDLQLRSRVVSHPTDGSKLDERVRRFLLRQQEPPQRKTCGPMTSVPLDCRSVLALGGDGVEPVLKHAASRIVRLRIGGKFELPRGKNGQREVGLSVDQRPIDERFANLRGISARAGQHRFKLPAHGTQIPGLSMQQDQLAPHTLIVKSCRPRGFKILQSLHTLGLLPAQTPLPE